MIKSMTGFGRCEIAEADDVKLKRILKEYKMSEKKEDK